MLFTHPPEYLGPSKGVRYTAGYYLVLDESARPPEVLRRAQSCRGGGECSRDRERAGGAGVSETRSPRKEKPEFTAGVRYLFTTVASLFIDVTSCMEPEVLGRG
jgi:hypothetical protein